MIRSAQKAPVQTGAFFPIHGSQKWLSTTAFDLPSLTLKARLQI
jgi:hypothetical protein